MYEEAYIEDSNENNHNHYYDYWIDSAFNSTRNFNFEKPQLEFFADDFYSEKYHLPITNIISWINPSLLSVRSNFTNSLPYEGKDYYDLSNNNLNNFGVTKGDWFPFDITYQFENDEDSIEFSNLEEFDHVSYISDLPAMILPRDSDRHKLSKFITVYKNNLETWHSYQINKNFYKLPANLKANISSISHHPFTRIDWISATRAVSKIFLPTKEFQIFSTNSNTKFSIDQIDKIWERVAYEIEKNPRKLYDFLTDNSFKIDIFKDTFFGSKKSIFKYINFFNKSSSNFLIFLDDYFASYTSIVEYSNLNKNYSFNSNKFDVLYSFSYLKSRAEYDFSNFYSKFIILLNYKQFYGLGNLFQLLSKYKEFPTNFYGFSSQSHYEEFTNKIIYAHIEWFSGDSNLLDHSLEHDSQPNSIFDFFYGSRVINSIISINFFKKYIGDFVTWFEKQNDSIRPFYQLKSLNDRHF
jgi:hypothetical protein